MWNIIGHLHPRRTKNSTRCLCRSLEEAERGSERLAVKLHWAQASSLQQRYKRIPNFLKAEQKEQCRLVSQIRSLAAGAWTERTLVAPCCNYNTIILRPCRAKIFGYSIFFACCCVCLGFLGVFQVYVAPRSVLTLRPNSTNQTLMAEDKRQVHLPRTGATPYLSTFIWSIGTPGCGTFTEPHLHSCLLP